MKAKSKGYYEYEKDQYKGHKSSENIMEDDYVASDYWKLSHVSQQIKPSNRDEHGVHCIHLALKRISSLNQGLRIKERKWCWLILACDDVTHIFYIHFPRAFQICKF